MSEFDKEIGLHYLRAMQLNDLTVIRRKITIKTLDCMSFLLSLTEIQIYLFLAEVILKSPPFNTYSKTHDRETFHPF